VFCIDQRSIGLAAAHVLLPHGLVLVTRFDMFHRAGNDVSLATTRACDRLLRKAMLVTAHVFALSAGAWSVFCERSELMEFLFLSWILDHLASDNTLSATPKQWGCHTLPTKTTWRSLRVWRTRRSTLTAHCPIWHGAASEVVRCWCRVAMVPSAAGSTGTLPNMPSMGEVGSLGG